MRLPIAFLLLLAGTVPTHAVESGQREPVVAQSQAQVPVMPPTTRVEGGYRKLSAAWWQWAMSLPLEPYLDPDGRFCRLGQEGAVWFLAGTDGSFDARRECRVPHGKYLFLPIINMIHHTPLGMRKGGEARSCKELQAAAAVNNDYLVSAVVLIDGVKVADPVAYRARSEGCFPLYPGLAEDERYTTPVAASDGYWLMIEPLPVGRHVITVGANYGAPGGGYHRMLQNFEYVLLVGVDEGFATR